MAKISNNIRFLRELKNWTQKQASENLGVTDKVLSTYERGKNYPDIDFLVVASDVFGVTIDDLIKSDLSTLIKLDKNVHLNTNLNNTNDVHLNVHPSVHLNRNLAQEPAPEYIYKPREKTQLPKVVVTDPQGNENVVFVPVKARAGYLAGYGDTEYIQKLPVYRLPGLNNGTYRAFEVSGVSMETLFYEGDVVICKWVERLSEVREKDVYVFLTETEGIAIKRVLSHILSANKVLLGSENPLYSPVLVDYAEIREIWHPVAYMSTSFRTQNSLETRISELETRLFRIEEKQAIHPLK